MADNRLQREITNRTSQERPKQWQQAELLPEPDKAPGFAYRWIRVSTLDKDDLRNLSAKLREGWEVVSVEEQPKFKLLVDPNSRYKDSIEIGGLLLCKTPSEFIGQRTKFFTDMTRAQEEAVDNNLMRQSDARMPIFNERRSSTSFGKGT
jgi:hypothetical protein